MLESAEERLKKSPPRKSRSDLDAKTKSSESDSSETKKKETEEKKPEKIRKDDGFSSPKLKDRRKKNEGKKKRGRRLSLRSRLKFFSANLAGVAVAIGNWIDRWFFLVLQSSFKIVLLAFIVAFLYISVVSYLSGNPDGWKFGLAATASAVATGWISHMSDDKK